MTTKEALHRLIEELPETALPVAEHYLASIRDDPLLCALANAPLEDEELSPEEEAALAEAWADYQRGDVAFVSDEELTRRIGG